MLKAEFAQTLDRAAQAGVALRDGIDDRPMRPMAGYKQMITGTMQPTPDLLNAGTR